MSFPHFHQLFPAIWPTLLLLLSGCATVVKTPMQRLSVRTDPPGAYVQLSTGERGLTPYSVWKWRRRDLNVYISKPGYKSIGVEVLSRVSTTGIVANVGNVAIGGLIGVGIDWAAGSTYMLYPGHIEARLAPLKSSAPSVVLEKGQRLSNKPQSYASASGEEPSEATQEQRTRVRAALSPAPDPRPPVRKTPPIVTTGGYRTDNNGTVYAD